MGAPRSKLAGLDAGWSKLTVSGAWHRRTCWRGTGRPAARLAFDGQQMVAVLISQKVLGFKDFRELAK